MRLIGILALAAAPAAQVAPPYRSKVWVADNGDGTYRNPILHADYSDPDVMRIGDDYYLTASSFNAAPGLPILHSKDLVNWELIGHVYAAQPPFDVYNKPGHGNGSWAPAMRRHNGEVYIFYPDPDFGIYMVKAKTPAGPWSAPLLIKRAKGWIDPCPLWDDDGKAYLVSAMSASRSALKSTLVVSRMDPDGTRLLDEGVLVYDGHAQDPTVEGPKFYKRNGYYYIFAPAGGVAPGWQLALRSKNVYGPYERKVVLAQGKTATNGPHQGGWVETPAGESWFVHFQDKGPYGRVVHLEPMKWVDDWPVMGDHGEPVETYRKPNVGRTWPIATPAESDEFSGDAIGLQWQWQANPQAGWGFPSPALGVLRLYAVARPEGYRNFWDVPNLLLQKFPAPEFRATAKMTFTGMEPGDQAGLVVMGMDYGRLSVRKTADGLAVSEVLCADADLGKAEREAASEAVTGDTFYLRVTVSKDAMCRFRFSTDGVSYREIGEAFAARQGKWIGAKVGVFALGTGAAREYGFADFDWFRVE
jgi:beta-xylosidase